MIGWYVLGAFAGGIVFGLFAGTLLGIAVSVKIEDIRHWLYERAVRRSMREMRARYTGPIDIKTRTGKRGTNSYGDDIGV